VSPSLTTFLFEAANFIALAALLAWLFFKPVRQAIEDQRAKIKAQEEEAAQKLTDAERMRQEINTQHKGLATELEQLRTKARAAAKQESEALLATTRAQLERERSALRRDALNIENAQTAKLAQALAAAAYSTVKRFFEQMAGPELEQLLIKAACRELSTFSSNALESVTVESAAPLDAEAQGLIASVLGTAKKTAAFRVSPELVAGVRISTLQGLIDASVAGLAAFAEQALTEEITALIREESDHA
jgi:F0F1-type ATP synthase membrane subunit b/b'